MSGRKAKYSPGTKDSLTYKSWRSMLARCQGTSSQRLPYKEKGIEVCKEWRKDYFQFLKDMGERPEGTSIDRINNDLGYTPTNCRWASDSQQQRNRGKFNVKLFYRGEYKLLCEVAELAGIPQKLLRTRLKQGMILEDAVEPFNYKEKKFLDSVNVENPIPHREIVRKKRVLSEETRRKISASLKGKKGRIHKDETLKIMQEKRRLWWTNYKQNKK